MTTRTSILLLLSVLSPCMSQAASTRISGSAPGAEGKEIRVEMVADRISYHRTEIASAYISPDGRFELSFELGQISNLELVVDHHRASLLTVPGDTYDLRITAFSEPAYRKELNPYLQRRFLSYVLNHPGHHPLLGTVATLNQRYDEYISRNFMQIKRKGRFAGIDTLDAYLFKGDLLRNAYTENMVRYRIAVLEELAGSAGRDSLFRKYIAGQPILYEHPDYMEFFSMLFERYLTQGNRSIPVGAISDCLTGKENLTCLTNLLGRDSLLVAENIRELVFILNLRDLYHHPDLDPAAVLAVAGKLQSATRFPEHRRILENLRTDWTRLQQGAAAPSFQLPGLTGDTLSPEAFRGKYLYLYFTSSWCTFCRSEEKALALMAPVFESELAVMGIAVDEDQNEFLYHFRNAEPPWPLAYFEHNYRLLEAYRLRAVPTYILLDRTGRILRYPAPAPSEGLDRLMRQVLAEDPAFNPPSKQPSIPGKKN